MANNTALIEVKDRGWLNGFGALWRKENHGWWRTRSWLVQILIWTAIIDGMLAVSVFTRPKADADQAAQKTSQAEESPVQTALELFLFLAAVSPAVGVIIIGQEAIIDERKSGTAAWVLSKPVSRAAFLFSKMGADALVVLVTMVLVPGFVGYYLFNNVVRIPLSIHSYLAGLCLVYLVLLYFLMLTLMLGTLFHSRGPVIGIPLLLVFGANLASLSWLGIVLPWNLVLSPGPGRPALAVALAQGQPLPTVTPIISTGLLVILFIVIALVRFEREEF